MQSPLPIVLASTSPRRRDLLAAAGVRFDVERPRDIDESPLPGEAPEELVKRLAAAKASSLAEEHPERLVLGADTIVYLDGEILGKPADLAEAAATLGRLSGRTHQVYTGVCLTRARPPIEEVWCSVSQVTFHQLDDAAIEAAMALTNPLDKAGSYAIQEQADVLVQTFTGYLSTIIGLPVEEVVARLEALEERS